MSESERQLLELIRTRAFRQAPPGQPFRLASGGTSSYYIDGKMIEVFSPSAALIGEVLYERTRLMRFDAIGGLEAGAVPLTTAAVIAYHRHGKDLEGFWVRDEAKRHGTKKLIEGNVKPGARVIVVDDVITEGGSALRAVQALREAGCEVLLVLALVDRLRGARERFRDEGIPDYQSVFTIRDLGVEADVPAGTSATAG